MRSAHSGELLLNGAELVINEPDNVFTDPGYAYTVEPATEELAARISIGAGPRASYRDYCP